MHFFFLQDEEEEEESSVSFEDLVVVLVAVFVLLVVVEVLVEVVVSLVFVEVEVVVVVSLVEVSLVEVSLVEVSLVLVSFESGVAVDVVLVLVIVAVSLADDELDLVVAVSVSFGLLLVDLVVCAASEDPEPCLLLVVVSALVEVLVAGVIVAFCEDDVTVDLTVCEARTYQHRAIDFFLFDKKGLPVSEAVFAVPVWLGVALLEAEWDLTAEEDGVAVGVQTAADEASRLAKAVPSVALQSSSLPLSHFHDAVGYFSLNASSALP